MKEILKKNDWHGETDLTNPYLILVSMLMEAGQRGRIKSLTGAG